MSDTERVFALYVQVNPVAEPDLLPLTRDEAELPTIEGSTFMDTKERIEVRPPERVRRWKPAVVVAAAFVVVLGIVGGVLLLAGDGEPGPVAAADARPLVTCDGESCSYDGPTLITAGTVEFTLVNNGPREITLGVWTMSGSALAAELERTPVGTDMALGPDDPMPDGDLKLSFGALAGETTTFSGFFVGLDTTHLVDCVTSTEGEGGFVDHVWRVAAIEVVTQ